MSSVSAQDEKWKQLSGRHEYTRRFLGFYKLEGSRRMWGLVFTTFIYWAEYKHGNNINWIHSQSLLDLFALLYWVGWKIPENGKWCQDGWEAGTKIGKVERYQSFFKIKFSLEWWPEAGPIHTMDSPFCHNFFLLQYWHSVPLGDINLEMERWQIHIYTWYIDIFTSAIWTRWSIEYQISFLQDFAWHSSSIRKCVASRGCEQPPRKTSAWINVSLGSLGSSSRQVFALNNYQNYVELVSIATRKSNKKVAWDLHCFNRSTIIDIQGG